MSAVTAAVLIGSTPRVGAGIIPRWIALLHEGRSYAWHLLRLQLSVGELGDNSRDDPPGVLWRASAKEDIAGELALLLHLYAARTPEVVQLTRRIRHLQRRRVDLSGLQGVELAAFENAMRIARTRGRELRLAATILPGSRLTDDHLLALPDWELEVSYSAFSRDWSHADGGTLVINEHHSFESDGLDLTVGDDHDDEFLHDSDAHAFADHPGNHAVTESLHAPDPLVHAAEAQAGASGFAAESLAAGSRSDDARSGQAGSNHSSHGNHGNEAGHSGSEAPATHAPHAPGAASAWLERDEAAAPRGRGLLDLLRFNR